MIFRKLKNKNLIHGDMGVWAVFIILCAISLVEVYSASARMTFATGAYWAPIMQHASFMLMGIFIAWLVHFIPCNYFKLLCTIGIFMSIFLLIAVLAIGQKTNDAGRWIQIGFIRFQPSEIAKLSLVGFSCFILSSLRDEKGASPTALKIVALATFITIVLIFTENASTAFIIIVVMYFICFYAQIRRQILIATFCLGALGIGSVSVVVHSIPEEKLEAWSKTDGPLHRLSTWVHRITDKQERPEDPKKFKPQENPQKAYAKVAIATSNGIGRGPGNSKQRDFIPQAFSDFIYAIIIEELGIIGAILVLALYLVLMYRSMRIAQKCKALFPSYLVMGLSLMIVVQAMMNMAVAVGAFPVTGQPLPLVSRGGTSIFITCTYIGMILSVSHTAKRKPEYQNKELPWAVEA
ncbi:MAG: FtsW/RodA/SpoVE family cell cycle protein [Prevotellaceae bacterium]|nr:FtsW/RodA/SpoVE family cell cycle protein [Prevotellaceae bacterium]